MKILTDAELKLIWIPVYRDEVEPKYDPCCDEDHYPCVALLIPEETLRRFLSAKALSYEYYEKESVTHDFDGLYEFAKNDVVAMRYCK